MLKLSCWIVVFFSSFLQSLGLSCIFICVCSKMLCSWKGGWSE